jgi:ATP-dependent DNA helicase PIF1
VVDAVVRERVPGIFFTGAAGTGKSVVLAALRRLLPPAAAAFTASTGAAAVAIGGETVHAWAGCSPALLAGVCSGTVAVADAVEAVRRRRDAKIHTTATLFVDEVSMLDADTFDALEAIARGVRGSSKPFGGIQLALTGDFCQLPPVSKAGAGGGTGQRGAKFAFQSASWGRCVPRCVVLTEVFRQAADPAFAALLEEARWGRISPEHAELLRSRVGAKVVLPAPASNGAGVDSKKSAPASSSAAPDIVPTKLHTHRAAVDAENARQLERLPGPGVRYVAADTYHNSGSGGGYKARGKERDDDRPQSEGPSKAMMAALAACCPAPQELTLKLGAQVMLNKTVDASEGLVNGAKGIVIRFTGGTASSSAASTAAAGTVSGFPIVRFASGVEAIIRHETWSVKAGGLVLASRTQLPLDL